MTPRECAHCHRFTEPEWIAYSERAKADICLRCWERLPPENLRILGLNLNIPPCAKCGEPLGARYWRDKKRVCWQCTGIVEPSPPKWKDTPYALFHRRVCANWRKSTAVSVGGEGQGFIGGLCPVCRAVSLRAQVVDAPSGPKLSVDECANECPAVAIASVLLT
jgi:hypothetical protein